MKSLGPDAYINEDPEQKPTHISQAVSEALSQVGPPAKPATGASMPENQPEKGPKRSTPKDNKTTPEKRSSNGAQTGPDPQRSPGRPPKMRIDSFNIDTNLELDERFVEFRELTETTEAEALFSIMTLYKYVARHQAATGSVKNLSDEKLAKRCYWQKEPELFIKALIESGFLTPDRIIADWRQTQPHATRRAYNLQHYQKQKDKEFQSISVNFNTEIPEMRSDRSEKRRQRRQIRSEKTHDSEKRLENAETDSNVSKSLLQIVDNLAQTFGITSDNEDYTTIYNWLQSLMHQTSPTIVLEIVSKIKQQVSAGKVKKPVGYLISTVKEQLQTFTPEENSPANQKPTPVCPECNHLILDTFRRCNYCDYVLPKPPKNATENPEK